MKSYCTHIDINEKTRLDLFTSSCFRVRYSDLEGEKFPEKYEIPFAVGKVTNWDAVWYEEESEGCTKTVKTKELTIKLRSTVGYNGIGFLVYDKEGKRLFPVDEPKYGMFVNKCIVFDSASFFGEYSGCSRYAHAFYDKESGEYSRMLPKDALLDLFFIHGNTYKQCYAMFNELVGAEPLLPIKAYGGIQTQHLGAKGNQRLLMQTARLFRQRDIPCDNLIIDYEWGDGADGGKELPWGSGLDWSSEYKYPLSPKQMIDELQNMGFDVTLIHHSIPDYEGRCDEEWVCSPRNADEWWKKIDSLISDGVKGTWQDTRQNDVTDSRIYEGFSKRLGKRPHFIANYDMYSISGWTAEHVFSPIKQRIGGRRTPYHWTGDMTLGSFEEFSYQIKAIINEHGALKGVSYITNDGMRIGGLKLAVRAEQFMCFNSVMRSHNPKPWETGKSADELLARMAINGEKEDVCDRSSAQLLGLIGEDLEQQRLIRKFLKLRYRLLPYIYTTARQTYDGGIPITRPLMIEFEGDENCNRNQYPREYMFGDKILVCPVYTDLSEMKIYFPSGCDWIDFFTGKKYSGGCEKIIDVSDLETMPVFVKNGSVITTCNEKNYIVQGQNERINLEIFGTGNDKIALYEDDGQSFGYKKGECSFTEIYAKITENTVQLKILPRQGHFNGAVKMRTFAVVRGEKSVEFSVDTEKICEFIFDI